MEVKVYLSESVFPQRAGKTFPSCGCYIARAQRSTPSTSSSITSDRRRHAGPQMAAPDRHPERLQRPAPLWPQMLWAKRLRGHSAASRTADRCPSLRFRQPSGFSSPDPIRHLAFLRGRSLRHLQWQSHRRPEAMLRSRLSDHALLRSCGVAELATGISLSF